MTSPDTIQRDGRTDWTLMTTIHAALRRDLDQLLRTTASRTVALARWRLFRDQLRLHLAAEQAAVWPLARVKIIGDSRGQALIDAMEDEHQLIGPLLAVTDDAFTMDTDPTQLRQLLTREVRYLDTTPLAGSAPHAAPGSKPESRPAPADPGA